ncbi:MAG: hypothetical protein OEU53_06940 [Gammaproteobacteria bacterium]|nr:hypothetical protein [Gammaproteobacteria bacterium]
MDWLAENDGLSITASADADAAFSSVVEAKAAIEKSATMGKYLKYFIIGILLFGSKDNASSILCVQCHHKQLSRVTPAG